MRRFGCLGLLAAMLLHPVTEGGSGVGTGEGTGEGGEGKGVGDPKPSPGSGEKMITETEANRRAASARREADEKRAKDLEELSKEKNLSDTARQKLAKELEEVNKRLEESEGNGKAILAKKEGEWKGKLETEAKKAAAAEKLFKDTLRKNAIRSALGNDAWDADQTVELVFNRTTARLIDGKDGTEPEHYEVVILDHEIKDEKKGTSEKKTLTIPDYISWMKTQKKFNNQWTSQVTGGTGRNGAKSGAGGTASTPLGKIKAGLEAR